MNTNAITQLKQQCREAIASAVKTLYKIEIEPQVDAPAKEHDAASPVAFMLARQLKKNPAEIAEKIAEEIKQNVKTKNLIAGASALNGYVNFTASEKFFQLAAGQSREKNYGDAEKTNKKAVVEYSSPNVGKPLHIGHVRSTIYGDAVKKILQSQGWKVVGSNFLCEAGTQVAKLITGLRRYGAKKIKDERELLDYYVKINAEIEKNPALEKQTDDILEKMEAGNKEIAAELKKVHNISMPPLEEIYQQLGVKFDEEVFDTQFIEDGKKVVGEALKNGIAFRDKNGETVANLELRGLPNLIILRSNGTTLYSTRDLGLAEARWRNYKPDLSVIVTASDQNLHFKQFTKILELLKKPIAARIRHIGYGLVVLPEGKISSRAGRVVLLQDVIDEASREAESEILARESNTGKTELQQRSRAIGIGALKFAILKVSAEKNITFDFKKMVSFEGDTGAYVQYSLVRCKSILRKAKEAESTKSKNQKSRKENILYNYNAEERTLLLHLAAFPEVLANAAKSLSPHTICDYLLRTCAAFSTFYTAHSVLEAETPAARKARLQLVKATASVIEHGLKILGINAVEKM